jgi:cell filamentation protein
MGLFAYGHPFLDGNGRTMLLVHKALCQKAGFTIDSASTAKTGCLSALSEEIAAPNGGHLNKYLLSVIGAKVEGSDFGRGVPSIAGLDGFEAANPRSDEIAGDVDGALNDPSIAERYLAFDRGRGYVVADDPSMVTDEDSSETDSLCSKCHCAQCVCRSNAPRTPGG